MYKLLILLIFPLSDCLNAGPEGILCFKCSATRESRIPGNLPCSEFDWSEKYVVECPKSTLCYRKKYTIPFGIGHDVEGIELGCAPQSQQGQDYNIRERKWYPIEKVVDSAYKEGCTTGIDKGRPGSPVEYCFCKYYLCNESHSIREIRASLVILHIAGLMLCIWANFRV